jgi:signal transduction histidine kinase
VVQVKRADGAQLGTLTMCSNRSASSPKGWIGALVVLLGALWLASWAVARSLVRPLGELADVARRMGQGELEARAVHAQRAGPEIASVADAIHEMAARIDRQMRDQRTLLAAVSHELRTPLGHLRLLVELVRDGGTPRMDDLEREVLEMDDLVDQLLATSRLDFALQEARALDVVELGVEALERSGYGPELLEVRGMGGDVAEGALQVSGDPTLLRRALANLLRNAREHGGGPTALVIEPDGDSLVLVVEDAGPGLDPLAMERLFDPFVQLPTGAAHTRGALGLGLYLVRRVALAHGGDVVALARPGGGARVGMTMPWASKLRIGS